MLYQRLNKPLHPAIILIISAYLCIGWADTWEGIRAGAAQIKSVQAEFIQEKHLKILARPLISNGSLYFESPGSLRWEYITPIHSILLIHNGASKRYIESDGHFKEDDAVRLQAMQVVMQEITLWLNGRFDANPDFQASLVQNRKIVLTPKQDALALIIKRITLQLSEKPGIIDEVMIFESEDSYTRLVFKNPVLNLPINETIFTKVR
ncbi:outer membrane lipoprotein carrier protein LolA [Desulfococcaceae bacterium HSG9]|nr:outer membrane lipoprotein carrier protein LolA [Desulfococcaceae bacterium HSG9]